MSRPLPERPAVEEDTALDLRVFEAGVFDLDGVVTDTAGLHAAAWKSLFDDLLGHRALEPRGSTRPFDVEADYRGYVDGKPRSDGIRDFLASRDIVLPEGDPQDLPGCMTVCGLGKAKNAKFLELLDESGLTVFADAVTFLRILRSFGLKTAVVSASENTVAILHRAGLTELFDACVDGVEAARLALKGKPEPDTFRRAAALLGVPPGRAFGIEDSLAGIAAIRAAGYGRAIGVNRTGRPDALADRGAHQVVANLGALGLRAEPRCATAGTDGLAVVPCAHPGWTIVEDGYALAREHAIESLFTVANGCLGTRGSLAEGSPMSAPATYVAGVFDSGDGLPELATIPDWTSLTLSVDGAKLRFELGGPLEHRRILDLEQGIFWREWLHQDEVGRITRLRELRCASLADRRLLLQSVTISPENYTGSISADASIGTVLNTRKAGATTIVTAAATSLVDGRTGDPVRPQSSSPVSFTLALGRTYRLDRRVVVHTSHSDGDAEVAARSHLQRTCRTDLSALVGEHRCAWGERWRECDIRIEGDPAAQRAVRFAIYHLLSAANPQDERISIGARALTGPGYKGHVFWDADIFMLPFFTLVCPVTARALLMYRYHTLTAARRRATRLGYAGALYAWESADTGDDVTPESVLQPGGKLIAILTGAQEQHISADVAYAVWSYWQTTADNGFLLSAGAEILIETARFWAGRVQRGWDGRFHILRVIGPDEYHESVDDNAYTNGMARWNLRIASRLAQELAASWPDRWRELSSELKVYPEEPATWAGVAQDMYTGFDARTGLIEQFRGYFLLEDIDLSAFEPRTAPMDVLLSRERIQNSKVIKQPDVLMLLYLLWDDYAPEVLRANFHYYASRCGHGSSLSPAIHAAFAARLGESTLAQQYFQQSMDIDLANAVGNSAAGVHAAALGGLWQAVVFGFGGLRLVESGPSFQPRLPSDWRSLRLRLTWRGQAHEAELLTPPRPELESGVHD